MSKHRAGRLYARRDEEGFALPLALAFLVLCTLITTIILDYTSTGEIMSGRLATQRNDTYATSSGIDSVIRWLQDNTASGSSSDAQCNGSNSFFTVTGVNGETVNIACTAYPGTGVGSLPTTAPNFAILTLAPYHNGPAPTSGCNNTYNELGIVQVQHSKLLQVKGNVYVNSDADSDIWSGGCPQLTTAQHIQVIGGDVLQRESEHDIDACPNKHNHVSDCGGANNNTYLPSPLSAADAVALADPGLAANDPTGIWAPDISSPPAAGTIRDANNNAITSCPAADPGTGYRLVKFTPGTFSDATVLNGFMNGTCSNAVFSFQKGDYYFNFTNAGTGTAHEWTINDSTTRIVGGKPFAGPSVGAETRSETWKPTVSASAASGSGTSQFATPNNAFAIDLNPTTATVANGGTSSLTLSSFVNSAGSSIPADAQINSVRLRVAHAEGNPSLLKAPTITITPASGSACTAVPVTPRSDLSEDAFPSYDVTNCLNDVSKMNGNTSLKYSVSHCTGTTGGCTTAATTDSVDGIWLDITYTTPGRQAWNPNDPSSITAAAPSVPGACLHEGDSGWNTGDGVQFVFGGDSRVNLKSGKFELCNMPSSSHQEIVVYGLRSGAAGQVAVSWNPTSATNGASGFANPNNALVLDNVSASAALSSSVTSRSITLNQFSPSTWPIPLASEIPAGSTINAVTLAVTHSESSTSQTNNPQVVVTSGTTTCPTATLAEHTNLTATGADNVDLTSCLNTPALLNAGVNAQFTARRSSSSPTENLDGMQLKITYTPPPSGGGPLAASTGCITQTPYYSPQDHSPAYNGACALLRVSDNNNGGSFPRVMTLWGTVYAPSAALDVPVDVMTVPVFNRGVVARMLMLGYNIENNAVVPITTTPLAGVIATNRHMVLTATIPGKTTRVQADVEFCDTDGTSCSGDPDVTGGTHIWSWKVIR